MITTVLTKTSIECAECGSASCVLSHELKDNTGSFVHAYDCDECGYSEVFIAADCDVCEHEVNALGKVIAAADEAIRVQFGRTKPLVGGG